MATVLTRNLLAAGSQREQEDIALASGKSDTVAERRCGDGATPGHASAATESQPRLPKAHECKRLSRPVEREVLLGTWAKLDAIHAHKAIVFSTCGFQRGAIQYAEAKGIATVTFAAGTFTYETRSQGEDFPPPSWVKLPHFAALWLRSSGNAITTGMVRDEDWPSFGAWLSEGTAPEEQTEVAESKVGSEQ